MSCISVMKMSRHKGCIYSGCINTFIMKEWLNLTQYPSSKKYCNKFLGWGRNGRGAKMSRPLTSFSPATSTKIEISPKNLLTFSYTTLLQHWCKFPRSYLVPVINYWTWAKSTPQKIDFSAQFLIKLRLL